MVKICKCMPVFCTAEPAICLNIVVSYMKKPHLAQFNFNSDWSYSAFNFVGALIFMWQIFQKKTSKTIVYMPQRKASIITPKTNKHINHGVEDPEINTCHYHLIFNKNLCRRKDSPCQKWCWGSWKTNSLPTLHSGKNQHKISPSP